MWKTISKLTSGTIILVLMAGCQTAQVKESAVENSLPVATAPEPDPVGTVYHGIRDGEKAQTEKIAQDGGMHTFVSDDGCQWTVDYDREFYFAPEVSWQNCNNSGEIEVHSKSGGMWPLEVGSSVSFDATGTSSTSSDSWRADHECTAIDEVQITVAAGTFDTYKVKCSTPWRWKTEYYAPAIERVVKTIQTPKQGSQASHYNWELVRVELP